MQLADDIEDLLDQNGRQTHRGLIEHQQLGTAHKRATHGKHLLLAAGKRAGNLTTALLQAGKMRVDALQAGRYL